MRLWVLFFFANTMPEHFGNLGTAILTLFGIVTLEGWVDLMHMAGQYHPYAWIYFLSFILLGTFIVINLFVAVVVSNLEQSFREQEAARLSAGLSQEELLVRLQLMFTSQATCATEMGVLIKLLDERKTEITRRLNGREVTIPRNPIELDPDTEEEPDDIDIV